jgi:hypothetical protein
MTYILATADARGSYPEAHCPNCTRHIGLYAGYCDKCKCRFGIARRWWPGAPKIIVAWRGKRPTWREALRWAGGERM